MAKTDDSPYDLLLQRVERLEHENETLRAAVVHLRHEFDSLVEVTAPGVHRFPASFDPVVDLLGSTSLGNREGWMK